MTLTWTVAGHELRKSLLRRRPVLFIAAWAGSVLVLLWVAISLPALNSGLYAAFPTVMLPLITPGFAAGAFAKEREQHTWQDLMLTQLNTRELLFGKFLAAYIPVLIVLLTLAVPVLFGMTVNGEQWTYHTAYSDWDGSLRRSDPVADFGSLGLKCFLQAGFYVSMAMVCSHYCSRARQALAVCYVALVGYALVGWMIVSSIDPRYSGSMQVTSLEASVAEQLHLMTCAVLTIGAWVLLAIGLKFKQE